MRRTARELLDAEGVRLKSFAIGEHRAACPNCALSKVRGDDDALAVRIDDKGFQLTCHRCQWVAYGFYEEHRAARPAPRTAPPKPEPASSPEADEKAARKQAVVLKVLKETQPAAGTVVQSYLSSRSINFEIPAAVRFHADLLHTDLNLSFPAMVVPFRDIRTNEICGLHRTYLTSDGAKITEGKARKMLGRSKGAALKLTPDEKIEQGLAIAEGVETSLSMVQIGYPVWALGSAGNVEEFPALAGIECLTVFADPDPAGARAADVCARRWCDAGAEARVLVPSISGGGDWNDWLRVA